MIQGSAANKVVHKLLTVLQLQTARVEAGDYAEVYFCSEGTCSVS